MFKRASFCLVSALAIFLMLVPLSNVIAQGENVRITVDSLVDDQFPQMDLYLSALNTQGFPILDLQPEHLTILEDNQPVANFQLTPIHSASTPMAVALAIDTSDSMKAGKPTALANSVAAANAFAGGLPAADWVGLLEFKAGVTQVQELTQDKALISTGLQSLKTKVGGTALYDAIQQSVEMLKDRPEKRAIVVLTDGKDEGSTATLEQAIQSAKDAGIPVYLVGFGKVEKAKLNQIAQETGGSAQIKPDSTQVDAAFQAIQATFREQYRIQYRSGLQADGNAHTLAIKMAYQGWNAEQQATFTAKPNAVGVSLPDIRDGDTIGGFVKLAPLFNTTAGEIAVMDLALDSNPMDSVPAAPFEYTWDTSKVPAGQHTLTISAKDISGNTGEMSMNLNIRPAVIATFSKPQSGEQVKRVTPIELNVDSLAQVAKIELFAGTQAIGTIQPVSVSPAAYSFDWDTTKIAPGDNVLRALVTDVNGLTGEASMPVRVVVQRNTFVLFVLLGLGLALLAVLIPTGLRRRRKAAQIAGQAPGSAAVPQSSAMLREMQGLSPGSCWPLQADEVRIGRKRDENDIALQGLSASRRHAVLRRAGDGWKIISLNPENPVVVNGSPVQEKVLQMGDAIQMGDSVFQFEA